MLWKCRLGNDGQFGSASSVKSIVSELFPRGSIGNRSALVQLVAWNRPDAKPFPKPMMTWLMQICQRCVKILSSKTYYIDTFSIVTQIPPLHMCTGHPPPPPPPLHMCTGHPPSPPPLHMCTPPPFTCAPVSFIFVLLPFHRVSQKP